MLTFFKNEIHLSKELIILQSLTLKPQLTWLNLKKNHFKLSNSDTIRKAFWKRYFFGILQVFCTNNFPVLPFDSPENVRKNCFSEWAGNSLDWLKINDK